MGTNLGTHGGASRLEMVHLSRQELALFVGLAVGPSLGTHDQASRQEEVALIVGLAVNGQASRLEMLLDSVPATSESD